MDDLYFVMNNEGKQGDYRTSIYTSSVHSLFRPLKDVDHVYLWLSEETIWLQKQRIDFGGAWFPYLHCCALIISRICSRNDRFSPLS